MLGQTYEEVKTTYLFRIKLRTVPMLYSTYGYSTRRIVQSQFSQNNSDSR